MNNNQLVEKIMNEMPEDEDWRDLQYLRYLLNRMAEEKDKEIKCVDASKMAAEFHRIYEEESEQIGWKTQKKCRVHFDELPPENKRVMLRTCARIIEWINGNQEDVGVSAGDMIYFASKEIAKLKAELLAYREGQIKGIVDRAKSQERKKTLDEIENKISGFKKARKGITNKQILKHWDTFILHLEELKKEAGEL